MTDNVQNNAATCSTSDSDAKLRAKIKETWTKLSDEDVKLYATNSAQFFGRLQEKQNVSREDGEKHLKEFEKSCGCASSKAA